MWLGILAALFASLTGCERAAPQGCLVGRVTFDDAPVTVGEVRVHSVERNQSAAGPIRPDGSYRVDGAPAGAVVVVVYFPDVRPEQPPHPGEGPRPPEGGPLPPMPPPHPGGDGPPGLASSPEILEALKAVRDVPERYKAPNRSGLKVNVSPAGETKFDLTLARDP